MNLRRSIVALLFVSGFLAACSAPDPYVYKKNEFDRSNPDFGKDPTDIKEVTVCYARQGTLPSQVSTLATTECGKFGKVPVFREQSYAYCPLMTPVAAIYDCVAP